MIQVAPDPDHQDRMGGITPDGTPVLFEGTDVNHGDMENPVFMLRIYCIDEDGSGPTQHVYWEYCARVS